MDKGAFPNESTSRASGVPRSPSGAELGYTLLALLSFTAALYALWLASISAHLGPNPADSDSAGIAWKPVLLACLVAAGLIWVSISMLSASSHLAAVRRLSATIQALNIPDAVKLEIIMATGGTAFQRVAPIAMTRPSSDESIRAAVAGNWVLHRFSEGASVIAVPKTLATAERLQKAFGTPEDRTIQVLRNDLDLSDAERVP